MKRLAVAVGSLFLLCACTFAQKTVLVTGQDRFEADFPSGGQLRLHIQSGDLKVIGSDEDKIKIRYWGKNAGEAHNVRVSLRTMGNTGVLHVRGGPRNEFRIEIQIPKASNLFLRMPAGDADVENLVGDKDVELHAGDLTMAVGSPEEYALADASVLAGDLETGPFGVYKGGLFRSFRHQGAGKYKLHAHVGAGDLRLKQ
ncbi:MAG TPA: hypothetical protein VEF05_11795 [Terriglobales bacterium]|nr:hypothetical protein [Terriglobales bacterium]